MSLEEKIDYIGGTDWFFRPGVPRLGVPSFRMADGPFGVRLTSPSTAMAAGIALAARGIRCWLSGRCELGRDSRARGITSARAGCDIYRAPMNGRNFEYYGEDPLSLAHRGRLHQGVQTRA